MAELDGVDEAAVSIESDVIELMMELVEDYGYSREDLEGLVHQALQG